MARRALGTCSQPGCVGLPVRRGRCDAHAEPAFAGNHERRASLGAPSGHARRKLRDRVRRRAGNRCESCGAYPRPGELFVVDHVVPIAEGGPSTLENLAYLCPACDKRKTALDLARMRETRPTRGE